jgi:hypothetical protein
MPQKKFELIFCRPWNQESRLPQGWTEVQPPTLKDKLTQLGLPDDDYYTILGLNTKQQDGSSGGDGDDDNNNKKSQGNGKSSSKSKGKKR